MVYISCFILFFASRSRGFPHKYLMFSRVAIPALQVRVSWAQCVWMRRCISLRRRRMVWGRLDVKAVHDDALGTRPLQSFGDVVGRVVGHEGADQIQSSVDPGTHAARCDDTQAAEAHGCTTDDGFAAGRSLERDAALSVMGWQLDIRQSSFGIRGDTPRNGLLTWHWKGGVRPTCDGYMGSHLRRRGRNGDCSRHSVRLQ